MCTITLSLYLRKLSRSRLNHKSVLLFNNLYGKYVFNILCYCGITCPKQCGMSICQRGATQLLISVYIVLIYVRLLVVAIQMVWHLYKNINRRLAKDGPLPPLLEVRWKGHHLSPHSLEACKSHIEKKKASYITPRCPSPNHFQMSLNKERLRAIIGIGFGLC